MSTNDCKVSSHKSRPGKTRRDRERKLQATIFEASKINEETACEMFEYRDKSLTLECLKAIVGQLGYHPYNIVSAVVQQRGSLQGDEYSNLTPLVAILYPLNENKVSGRYSSSKGEGRKPFPTTTWIVSRDLYSRISKLEDMGWVQKLQNRLYDGPGRTDTENLNTITTGDVVDVKLTCAKEGSKPNAFLQQMHEAHRRYASFRWSLLTESDKAYIEQKGW